uniref:hypothetical protein n=1 Tax=Bacillus sp. OTU530 TaxID=3043862 RepID=UPI00313C7602
MIKQDHGFIKKRAHPMIGSKSSRTAKKISSGMEAIHMLQKKQVFLWERSVKNQKEFIHQLFGFTTEESLHFHCICNRTS